MAEYSFIAAFARENTRYDYAGLHELTAAAGVSHERPPEGGPGLAAALDQRNLAAASLARDWPAVLAQGKKLEAAVRNLLSQAIYTRNFVDVVLTRQIWPFVARAMAMTGQVAGAEALIAKTPPDCTTCALNRANIAAAAGDWSGASTWFARTIAAAPSIPFAYADWGEMLLHQGKYDGAIDKFRQANLKGPQFADPLEMWGEALMQMNRSDLALAKFEEANKYAPNWGRLHLKWGEALTYAGQREDAKKQFAIASRLDLSPADRATLARVMRTHA
jgi:tetratricopeptide (TPR) repeat protein